MRKRLQLFFWCMLVVSLPMQSIAAIAKFECGMSHHSGMGSDIGENQAQLQNMGNDAAHAPMVATGSTAMQSVDSDEDCGSAGEHKRVGCAFCAGCSIGAYAPPPGIALTAAEEVVQDIRQFSLSSFKGHIPARIERPPKTA